MVGATVELARVCENILKEKETCIMEITGTKMFLRALEAEGVEKIFAYPGGTVTDLFDELYRNSDIDIVLPRHEQALVHEAEGYARETL